MEDDKIKQLFESFEPQLSNDAQFIRNLDRKLNSVEIIAKHNAEVRANNRKAVLIAMSVGFIVGFLLSLALPNLNNLMANWIHTIDFGMATHLITENFMMIAWSVIGITSIIFSINTYDVARAFLRPKPTD